MPKLFKNHGKKWRKVRRGRNHSFLVKTISIKIMLAKLIEHRVQNESAALSLATHVCSLRVNHTGSAAKYGHIIQATNQARVMLFGHVKYTQATIGLMQHILIWHVCKWNRLQIKTIQFVLSKRHKNSLLTTQFIPGYDGTILVISSEKTQHAQDHIAKIKANRRTSITIAGFCNPLSMHIDNIPVKASR